jgi:hypothetical protein
MPIIQAAIPLMNVNHRIVLTMRPGLNGFGRYLPFTYRICIAAMLRSRTAEVATNSHSAYGSFAATK